MKQIIASLVLVAGSSFAQAALEPMSTQEISEYRLALYDAYPGKMNCGAKPVSQDMWAIITAAQSGQIDRSGGQPLMAFEYVANSQYRSTVFVTTTADFGRIAEMKQMNESYVRVNDGDLKNPKMVYKWVINGAITVCAPPAEVNRD